MAGEEDPRELDAAALTTGERLESLVQARLVDAQRRGQARRLRLGGVPADGLELLLQPGEPGHRPLLRALVGTGHALLGGPAVGDDPVQPPRGEDALPRGDAQVTGARVLREVPDAAAGGDLPGRGLSLPGEHLGQRGLAGAVAAHETDPVARRDPEGRVLEQDPGARAQLDPGGCDHGVVLLQVSTRVRRLV